MNLKKTFLAIALISFSIPLAQAETITEIRGEATLKVAGLRCEVLAGSSELALEDRLNTHLGGEGAFDQLTFFGLPYGTLLLEHKEAFAKGCDLAELDEISKRSRMGYTFIHGVKTTLKRRVTDALINGFGNCVETVFEEVSFELAPGITLVSKEGKLRPSNRCK